MRIHALAIFASLSLVACGDDAPADGDMQELITRVELTFASTSSPTTVRARFDDPDGDGGEAPTVDPVMLVAGTEYSLSITFVNALEATPEDITAEISDESDEHQVFLTGSAVSGPASATANAPLAHVYTDTDRNGLPLGLTGTITAAAGDGDLVVTLMHLPPVNDVPVKSADTATTVRDGGFTAVNGDIDAQVTFAVTVR